MRPAATLPPAADESFAVPAGPEQLARAAAALEGNGYLVHVADTVADARELVRLP